MSIGAWIVLAVSAALGALLIYALGE